MSDEMVGPIEWGTLRGLSRHTVRGLLARGRIEGARQREDGRWLIPADAPAPPMRASRAPLVTPPDGLQSLASWAIEHGVSEDVAMAAHRDAGTLTAVDGVRFVPRGPLLPNYLRVTDWAAREGLSRVYAIRLARAGKLPGAIRVAREWMLPKTLKR